MKKILFHSDENNSQRLNEILIRKKENLLIEFCDDEYHFYPINLNERKYIISNTDTYHADGMMVGFNLNNHKNIHFTGNKSKLIFHFHGLFFALFQCKNIIFEGLIFAYSVPPVIDLEIISVNKKEVLFKVPKCYEWDINDEKISFCGEDYFLGENEMDLSQHYCSTTDIVKRVDKKVFIGENEISKIDDTTVKVVFCNEHDFNTNDCLQIRATKRFAAGGFISRSEDVHFKGIQFESMFAMGLVSQVSKNLFFDNIIFKSDDYMTTSGADCLHFSSCYGNVEITNSSFFNPHDDPINIHGIFMEVRSISGNEVQLEFKHPQTLGFNIFNLHDKIKLFRKNDFYTDNKEYLVEEAIESDGGRYITLKIDQDIEYRGDFVIQNITSNPNVLIKNCLFERIPTRGILVSTAGNVKIEDNHFKSIYMDAILLACDCNDWYEAGPFKNVEISNNTFENIMGYHVNVAPEAKELLDGYKINGKVIIKGNKTDNVNELKVRNYGDAEIVT